MIARLAAAMLLALGAGCSQLEFAYKHADVWLRWKASSYVYLEGEQARAFETRVAAFHAWHQAEALPEYARLATQAAARLERGATLEDMRWGYESVRERLLEELGRAGAELGELADSLTPAQLESIERGFARDNRKFAAQWLAGSEAERRERRLERMVERLSEWLGPLEEAQLARVREFNDAAAFNAEARDRDRRRRQAELLSLLQEGRGDGVADWASGWDRGRDPAYARGSRETTEAFLFLLADLERSLSEAQRKRVIARLRGHARGFQVLAGAR